MKSEAFISIYLDTRRAKANGKFPVKLRVFTSNPRIQKLYATPYEYSESEFESIWRTSKPRIENKDKRKQLQKIEDHAEDILKELDPFTFEQFEKKLLRNNGEGTNVFYHYEKTIELLTKYKQLGTASNYRLSQKSIENFLIYKSRKDKAPEFLHFKEITANWLNEYELYMTSHLKRSNTTVSMYVRALRTLFNKAIEEKDIDPEIYPFGKNRYNVPAVQNIKKALSFEQLRILFNAETQTPEQVKARDFWYFSYSCNGMNIKDIAQLKYGDIKGDTIEFLRAKTIRTSKANLKSVSAQLNSFTKGIIEKYGNPIKERDQLIFPFISSGRSEVEKFNSIKNFTRFINQNLKKLAEKNGITSDISTYWARHSFATNAVRFGASMEFVGEALSHSNVKTTQNYFAGFEESDKKELMKKMMAF